MWFHAYRQLFIFVVLFNTLGMILAILEEFPYAQGRPGALVLGNLLFAVLMRNELLLRGLYMLAIYSLRDWAPLGVRLTVTSVLQHVGGIHSGCALSSAGWLIYHVIRIAMHLAAQHVAILATGVLASCLMLISILSAFPWVRNNYHNVFERHHRFVGWLGLAFNLPSGLPSGNYLVRIEHIGVHNAANYGGAQFFVACGQVKVTGGGSGSPGPLVAFPGEYKADHPGIYFNNYYPAPTSYTIPGPPVWRG